MQRQVINIKELHVTSVYSADPIRPNSSAPQLPKMIDLRGLQFPASQSNRGQLLQPGKRGSLRYATEDPLTLLDLGAQHSAQLQHHRCPAAGVDGAVHPTVPVVAVDHVPVCGGKTGGTFDRLGWGS